MTSNDMNEQRPIHRTELGFLEEQLAALDEVRQDGHVSDIVSFAHDGLCRALELEGTADAQTCDRVSRLTADYRKLLNCLVH